MTREIKFRGQRLDNKEWVYGGYFQHTEEDCVIHYIFTFENGAIPVDKNTMCQFTGLKDKNGKEIYEGDILTKWDGLKKKVFFSDKYYNFQLSHLDNKGFCDTLAFWNQESTEVIGNIYENPELLSTPTAVL